MFSCWCTQYSVHPVCTHTVYTRQRSYNFGRDSAKFDWMYSCWCTQYSVHTVCTQTLYTCQQSYNLALFGAGTVRRHRLSARRMATSCIQSSSTCSGFSIQMFLRSQICPFFEGLTTILKVRRYRSVQYILEMNY